MRRIAYYRPNAPMSPKGWMSQIWRGKSPVRASMNGMLAETGVWSGRILDVGGTNQPLPTYRAFFPLAPDAHVTTLNIDAEAKPDLVADATHIPLPPASIDAIWCLNVLEHLERPEAAMQEMARVLVPGGRIACFTPFLVRVHGHPQDYFRFTETALRSLWERAGLRVESVRIAGGAPFLAAVSQIQPVFPRFLFPVCVLLSRAFDALICRLRPSLSNAWPLGILVIVKKEYVSGQ